METSKNKSIGYIRDYADQSWISQDGKQSLFVKMWRMLADVMTMKGEA